jgi:hypothetical protein
MRIERINDLAEILKCMPFEREIRVKGRDRMRESDMLLFIRSQLDNPMFGYWMSYNDEGEVNGYAIALLNLLPGIQREFIIRMYAKDSKLRDEFFNILAQWARAYKVKIQQTTVHKNIKAISRKFKFIPISVNMERRI